MKKINIVLCLGLCLAILMTCGKPRKVPTTIEFSGDFSAARQQARKESKPLVVEFYTPDSPWCRKLDDSTFTNKIVIEMSADMLFAKVNVDKDSNLADRFGVSFYPTVIVFNDSGLETGRLVGYYPPAEFFNEVQLYLQGKETLDDYLTRLEDEPDKIEYHLAVAEKYRNRSNWDKAVEYYSNVVRLSTPESEEHKTAMFEIATIYQAKEKYAKAIAAYKKYLELYPDSENAEDALRRIPFCYFKMGKEEKGLKLFKEYLDKHPRSRYNKWVAERIKEINQALKEGN